MRRASNISLKTSLRRRQNSGWPSMKIAVFVQVLGQTKYGTQPDGQL
jgi:hypothetical protein